MGPFRFWRRSYRDQYLQTSGERRRRRRALVPARQPARPAALAGRGQSSPLVIYAGVTSSAETFMSTQRSCMTGALREHVISSGGRA